MCDKKYGAMCQYDSGSKEWIMVSEVIAPKEKKMEVFKEILDYLLKNGKEAKVDVEFETEFNKSVREWIKDTKYKAHPTRYILYWPVFNMNQWDGHTMKGKKWKKMRNIKNRFYRENKVKVVDSMDVKQEDLMKVIKEWVKKRMLLRNGTCTPYFKKTEFDYYEELVKNGFEGVNSAKTLIVNGKPCSITAGWEVKNSKAYYSAIGIYNYAQEGLGEVANMQDLVMLKKKGYKHVDFGGSEKALLDFKRKFKPHCVYKTYTYSIGWA
ncbi:MAG: hypothetical protein GY861_06500 [bacterium]|nr:hypothetical protein [bacterium]